MRKKETILLLTLAAIQFTNIMDFMIMMPLGPQLMRLLSITPQQFSLLVAAYMFSAGIFGFLSSFIVDRYDRKTVLRTTYIGFLLGTLACALAPTYVTLILARTVAGLFGGILSSTVLSVVGDAVPHERRAAAMGIVMAGFSAASIFGVPFGLYMANVFDWHAPFFFLVGACSIIFILVSYVIPSMKSHVDPNHRISLQALKHIAQSPNQISALLLTVFLMLGQFTIIPFLSPYMVANVGFTEHQLAYIYFLGGLVSLVSSPIVGKVADKFGKPKVFTIFAFISLLFIFVITHLPPMAIGMVLIITTLFFIVVGGRMIPAMAMVTSAVRPQNRGSFMSINSSVQQFTAAIASFMAGAIVVKSSDGHLQHYGYVGYIAMAATLISIYLIRKIRPVDAKAEGDFAAVG